MGWSIGFGFGPIRYRASLGGRKRRRKRCPYHYGQIKVNGKVVWKCEHHHQTESAAIACSAARAETTWDAASAVTRSAAPSKDWHQPPVEGRSPLRQPTTGQAIKAAAANRRAQRAAEAEHRPAAPTCASSGLSRTGPLRLLPCDRQYSSARIG